jgi:hypothetical protein
MVEETYQKAVIIGAIIGALLGASIAYMLIKAPANLDFDEDPGHIKTKDLLDITNTATNLLRQLDAVRRKT